MTVESIDKGKSLKPIELVKSQLVSMTDKFSNALAGSVPSDRFVQVAISAVSQNPQLLEADRLSLYNACMKAATDGLVLDGREAALTVFNTNIGTKDHPNWIKKVQYMPMVRGIVKLMLASESILKVSAHVVYENDEFEHILGLDESVVHKRPKLGVDRGRPIGVYAIAVLREGGSQISVMDARQVEAVKACAKDKKVWDGPFADQQWEKTAIRRLSKRVEMGAKLQSVIAHDEEMFDLDKQAPVAQPESEQPQTGTKQTKAAEKILAKKPVAPVKQEEAEDAEFSEVPPGYDDDLPI